MSAKLGLNKHSKSPGSIANIEHHDATHAQRGIHGDAAQYSSIIPNSTIATPIEDDSLLRITNDSGATAYVFVGRIDQDPGALTAANAIAIPDQMTQSFFTGDTDDDSKSLIVKTSSSLVQVAIMK